MEDLQQPKQPINILKQQDISQLIKHFSFTIQQRFEEIQKNCNYFSCLNSINYDRSQIEKQITHKYSQYKTSDQHQIKLLEKFVQRILQIFDFFRQKTDQPQTLQQMSQKISQRFKQILKNQTNYNFFVNKRPKTHITNVKPLGTRSSSNDYLSIIAPGFQKNDQDLNGIFMNNKKSRTETHQKRVVEVGKLFKYVFSVLKRGYLVKLRMQRLQKKAKTIYKDSSFKADENTNTISVQGTCAILRNCLEKSNKQNQQNQIGRMLSFCKQRLSINPLGLLNQNKKQIQLSQKIKNRSISTNQYSFLSSQNPSTLKQTTSKIREIDRKICVIYDILNIQKYSIIKVAKQPQLCRKDQLKRNGLIQGQFKKYMSEYKKWTAKDKLNQNSQKSKNNQIYIEQRNQNSKQHCEIFQSNQLEQKNQDDNNDMNSDNDDFQNNQLNIFTTPIPVDQQGDSNQQVHHQNELQLPAKEFYQLQMNSAQNGQQSVTKTISFSTSRAYLKLTDKALTDKSSNLIDFNLNNNKDPSTFKSRSTTHQQKKALRLNLPSMLMDRSNYLNEPNIRFDNNTGQKSYKISQKSQLYLQNYHTDISEDGIFVPLMPKRDKNNENQSQNKNSFIIKKKNLIPNFHPLNRCRIFRQKKNTIKSIMVPLIDSKSQQTKVNNMNHKMKNVIF